MKRTMVGTSVAVVLLSASLFPAGLARADSISTTRDQVRGLQTQVASGAQQIRRLTVTYDRYSFEAASLAQQVTADQVRMAQLQSEVSGSRAVLREDAIISYTGGALSPPVALSGITDPSIRAEYLDVAAGDISDAVDAYRTQAKELQTAETILMAQQQALQNAAIATAAVRGEALAAAAREQYQLDTLQNRLSVLETAAVLAAQRRPAPPTQGLPVNNGMVSAVRSIVSPSPAAGSGGVWLQLRECESGNNYRADTGNGFYGAYQFSPSTWSNLGYPGRPDLEPPAMQDQAAMKLQEQSGWGQWPACAAALGLT